MFCRCQVSLIILSLLFVEFAVAQTKNCREKEVAATVYSPQGSPIPKLTEGSLQGTYGGKRVSIRSVAQKQPHRIILILDTSGSLLGQSAAGRNIPLAVAADMLAHIPPTLEIAAAFFDHEIEKVIRPTTNHNEIAGEVQALNGIGRGRTAIFDAISQSVSVFDGLEVGDVLYLITDGEDNLSRSDPRDVARSLEAAGIRLFCFKLKYDRPGNYQTGFELNLEKIVQDTGGLTVTYAPTEGALIDKNGRPSRAATELREQYRQMLTFDLLTIDLPEILDRPQPWRLSFTGSDDERRKLTILYPRLLMPCK
jgi:von Willebrand factor type A domain